MPNIEVSTPSSAEPVVVALPENTRQTTLAMPGNVRGVPGPPGPPGPPGDGSHRYVQGTPSSEWLIEHDLGFQPSVTVVDSAHRMVVGAVEYPSSTSVRVAFSAPFSGEAYLS